MDQEIYGGGWLPKLLPITTQLVEYTNLVETARALETKYAYNVERAREQIAAEMEAMGATLGSDGKWQYNGAPITLIFLIRSDGDGTRQPMGDYVSQSIGGSRACPIQTASIRPLLKPSRSGWVLWHLKVNGICYTAGYLPAGLTRDERGNIQQYYLPTSVQASDPFISNVADPELRQGR